MLRWYWSSEVGIFPSNCRTNHLQKCIELFHWQPIKFEESLVVVMKVRVQWLKLALFFPEIIQWMYPKTPGNYLHLPQHEYHENTSSMSSNLLKSTESIYSHHFSSAFKKSCEPEKEQKIQNKQLKLDRFLLRNG